MVESGLEVVAVRWAFWRRRSGQADDAVAAVPVSPPAPAPPAAPRGRDEEQDRGPVRPCSGASPDPGRGLPPAAGEPGPHLLPDAADPALDMAGVREDVVALVQAALDRDRATATGVLRRVGTRGPDGPGMASIAAMAGLGDRLVAAAGYAPGDARPGEAASAAVVAQGDTLAGRAQALLEAVAADASRDLVRLVVRFACGVPEQDPGVAHLVDAPPEDLALVASVLLAQTVLDGAGGVDELAEELADLLPG